MDFMDIPDLRMEGETPLEQAHNIMLRNLRIFDRICRKYDLGYWLDGGSALGALRHGGFVPWDDDLDVAMLRSDYEKFTKIVQKELPRDLFFQTSETDPAYKESHGKLRDRYSSIMESACDEGYQQGIFIDIFPMDIVSEDREKAVKEVRLGAILYMMTHKMKSSRHFCYWLMKRILYCLGRIIPKAFIRNLYCSMTSRYSLTSKSHISTSLDSTFRLLYRAEDIFPLGSVQFEGFTFSAPGNLENYVKVQFGENYMIPLAEQDRKTHSIRIDPFKSNDHRESLEWDKRNQEDDCLNGS